MMFNKSVFQPFRRAPYHLAPTASPIDYLHRPLLLREFKGKLIPLRDLLAPPQQRPRLQNVLVGIINGNEARRRLLSCTWISLTRQLSQELRVLFVLGNASLSTRWSVPDSSTLLVRCQERMYMHAGRKGRKPAAFTGTFTMYYKVVEFLFFAATQPQEFAVRVDDDAFVSPYMLLAYVSQLPQLDAGSKLYAGTFEWSSWRIHSMQATAFGYGFAEARGRAKFPWRNCFTSIPSVTNSTINASSHGTCVGPIAFAKGPFMMFNKNSLTWLSSNARVASDIRHASLLQSTASRIGRIDDDMQVGFWMSQAPNVRYLRFRRSVWYDRFTDQIQLSKILMVHRVPWLVYHSLSAGTRTIWERAAYVRVRALCEEEKPICVECAHDSSQRACIAEIEVQAPTDDLANVSSVVCPGPYPNRKPGRCPAFVRGTHPDAFSTCLLDLQHATPHSVL